MKRPPLFPVDETTLVFAFRYALGRRTTAPSHVVAQLKTHWAALNDWTRDQIYKEIRESIRLGEIGGHCDMKTWQEVLKWDTFGQCPDCGFVNWKCVCSHDD